MNLTDGNATTDEETLHGHLSLEMTNAMTGLWKLKGPVTGSNKPITNDDIISKQFCEPLHAAWVRDILQRLFKCAVDCLQLLALPAIPESLTCHRRESQDIADNSHGFFQAGLAGLIIIGLSKLIHFSNSGWLSVSHIVTCFPKVAASFIAASASASEIMSTES